MTDIAIEGKPHVCWLLGGSDPIRTRDQIALFFTPPNYKLTVCFFPLPAIRGGDQRAF